MINDAVLAVLARLAVVAQYLAVGCLFSVSLLESRAKGALRFTFGRPFGVTSPASAEVSKLVHAKDMATQKTTNSISYPQSLGPFL